VAACSWCLSVAVPERAALHRGWTAVKTETINHVAAPRRAALHRGWRPALADIIYGLSRRPERATPSLRLPEAPVVAKAGDVAVPERRAFIEAAVTSTPRTWSLRRFAVPSARRLHRGNHHDDRLLGTTYAAAPERAALHRGTFSISKSGGGCRVSPPLLIPGIYDGDGGLADAFTTGGSSAIVHRCAADLDYAEYVPKLRAPPGICAGQRGFRTGLENRRTRPGQRGEIRRAALTARE